MTNAERQRRYRERKREQQKAATADATPPVTSPVTPEAVTRDVSDLGTRGRRLWQDITGEAGDLKPAERVLLEEACRLADRLDRLDQILLGTADDWLRFHTANEDGTVVKVVVNSALVEVRQQQVALKALLAELRTSRGAAAGRSGTGRAGQGRQQSSTEANKGGGGGVVSIAAHVAGKLQGSAG